MKKEEAEKRLLAIQQDLDMLEPKDEEQEDPSYEDKITVLRYFMEQSLRPDNDEDIPEEVMTDHPLTVPARRGNDAGPLPIYRGRAGALYRHD